MWRFRILVGVVVFGLVAPAVPAQELSEDEDGWGDEICVEHYVDSDIERTCTATEEFGVCLDDAYDAYEGCREENEGLLGFLHCAASAAIDGLSCLADLVEELIPV